MIGSVDATQSPSGVPTGRPSIWAAWRWENRKAANRWYWPVLVVVCGIGQAMGYGQYVTYRDEFIAQDLTWAALWGQAILLPSMLFIPLAVGAFVAQAATGEHEGRNWQRMAANRLAGTMIWGKLLHTLQVGVATTLVFVVEFVITGLLLGFDPFGLVPYLARSVPVALAVWAIEVFVAWTGVVLDSFAAIMTTLLVATLCGLAVSMAVPTLASIYPLSLVTAASSARQLGSIAAMETMTTASIIAVGWVTIWTVALRRAVARAA